MKAVANHFDDTARVPRQENAVLPNCEPIKQKVLGIIVLKKVHFVDVRMTFSSEL